MAIWKLFTFFIHVFHSKIIGHALKDKQKKKWVCVHEIIRLIIMKMKMKKNNKRKYSKYKTSLNIITLICIKQHLSNFWSLINEKVKQHWGWVEKNIFPVVIETDLELVLALPTHFDWHLFYYSNYMVYNNYALTIYIFVIFEIFSYFYYFRRY